MKRSTCSKTLSTRENFIAYTFRGSEYGMCAHRHIACLRGMSEAPIDAKTRKMFFAGNRGEEVAKEMLRSLAAKDPRLVVEESATGWQNQDSVSIGERRGGFTDGFDREIRLICSPDGQLCFPDDFFFPDSWVAGLSVSQSTRPRRYALEVKCYGESSLKKFVKKGAACSETLEYQTSGVAAGYAEKFNEPVGVVVMVLRREEVKDDEGNFVDYHVDPNQTPLVWVYDAPRFTRAECLQRCWDIANLYEQGQWPRCTNSFFCKYPHRATPVLDCVAEDMLQTLADSWQRYQSALKDAEGILIGYNNGDQVHGFSYARPLISLPILQRL